MKPPQAVDRGRQEGVMVKAKRAKVWRVTLKQLEINQKKPWK
jgi:hypothetical protein